MDTARGLERFECKVTQYANSGEAVMPVSEVLARVSVEVPRAFTVFQNPANVSGTVALSTCITIMSSILGLSTKHYICVCV